MPFLLGNAVQTILMYGAPLPERSGCAGCRAGGARESPEGLATNNPARHSSKRATPGGYDRESVESEVAFDEKTEFDRAVDVADRFLANVETVVLGKREEIKLVLAAMTSARARAARGRAGHGEDRPRPRDRAHIDGARRAHPVHARPPADRRHRPLRLRPAGRATSSSGRDRSSRTSCSSTRSTGRCRRRSRRCSRPWPSAR